jgi:hypothetical protein
LLLDILPHIAKEKRFALKDGTAINMFVWDMPRLSVDIDLTYVPFDARHIAFKNILEALNNIRGSILKAIPGIKVETVGIGKRFKDKLLCTSA